MGDEGEDGDAGEPTYILSFMFFLPVFISFPFFCLILIHFGIATYCYRFEEEQPDEENTYDDQLPEVRVVDLLYCDY